MDSDKSNKKTNLVHLNQNITIIKALLPPEYEKYIELYGLPNNGKFDSEKLKKINETLNKGNK